MAVLSLLNYPYPMKYIALLVLIVFLVRIDFFMGLFEKFYRKVSPPTQEEISSDMRSKPDLIPVKKDVTLQQNPKINFLSLVEDFKTSPVAEIRLRAVTLIRENPTTFGQKLDTDLEAQIFGLRELVNKGEPELGHFIFELWPLLLGENQELLKRFMADWMDTNLAFFITTYARAKDLSCSIAKTFPYPLPEEEQLNQFYDREEMLNAFLSRDKLDPLQRELAQNCKLQVTLEIDKLSPSFSAPSAANPDSETTGLAVPTAPTEPASTPATSVSPSPSTALPAPEGSTP